MRTVNRYQLNYHGGRILTVPQDFRVLAMEEVDGVPTLWLEHSDEFTHTFDIEIIHRMDYPALLVDDGQHYIGTVVSPDQIVWHFFYSFK